ncbi:amino acid permease [Halalkalicoccus subterraneus]|uniref:amino acid permease n=1 Tax=Halalkalicoccus subterraneus TaxID=2675002 RepID=UPI000EFB91C0|nr:amino acid permease [Halalkalicoccus subterraneus]
MFGVGTAVALGVGGIVGGGIYAAIGIVVAAAGVLTWFAYSLATVVVLCCAYSYVKLNEITDNSGGSVSFLEELTDRTTVAGVIGWTLVVGYIGTMAMYAYAFGAYGRMMLGIEYVWGLPIRQFLSVFVIAAFVGLNLLGAGSTAAVERYLVFVQAGIIGLFGPIALWFGFSNQILQIGFSELGRSLSSFDFNPIIAASVGFVSFEGWQLLFYDQEQFDDPDETIAKGIFISIPIAAFIYVLVGFVITSLLLEEVVAAQPEAALLYGGLVISKWLALANRDRGTINALPPLVGTVGSAAFFVMLTWYLYAQLPSVFWLVVLIAAAVFTVEAVYFERRSIAQGLREAERQL